VDPATGAVAPWNAWLNGPVSGLVRSHGRVYLVGPFTRIRSATRNGAAALGTGLRLLAWKPPKLSAGPADDVTVFDGKVVLTGQFNWVGRTHRHGSLAAFDPVRGKLLDWGPPRLLGTGMQLVGTRGRHVYAILDGEPFTVVLLNRRTGRLEHRLVRHNGDVYDAVLRGRTLYLGGAFNRVAGAGRNGLAAGLLPDARRRPRLCRRPVHAGRRPAARRPGCTRCAHGRRPAVGPLPGRLLRQRRAYGRRARCPRARVLVRGVRVAVLRLPGLS